MSERVGVERETEGPVEVIAGGRVELRFKVQNLSQVVDQYDAQLLGLEAGWGSVVRPSVALFPGDSGELVIALHPPGGVETEAGRYPYTVRVVSRDDPSQYTDVPGELAVLPFGGIEAELRPERVEGRRGQFRVELRNLSNQVRVIGLRGIDPEEVLRYQFQRREVELAVGGEEAVGFEVVPPRRPFVGPTEEHRFRVEALEGPEGEEQVVRSVEGTYAYKAVLAQWPWARLPLWAQRALPFLALALAALGIFLATRPQSPPDGGAPTPTALAKAGGGGGTPTVTATATPQAAGVTPSPPAPGSPPVIVDFKTERVEEGGQQVYYVSWAVERAEQVTLNGAPVPPADRRKVEPVQSQEFVLQATNRDGSVSKSLGLVVLKPPLIKSFKADKASVKPGDPVKLSWETENAQRADISGDPIPEDRIATGNVEVSPNQTRDYVLTAENDFGWVVRRATVVVVTPTPSP